MCVCGDVLVCVCVGWVGVCVGCVWGGVWGGCGGVCARVDMKSFNL